MLFCVLLVLFLFAAFYFHMALMLLLEAWRDNHK